ncbi:MAG: tRNA 4-thiouridine(8) synthase ThiI [Thermoplasmata archaeon]|nr:MAG: tRNA 4-thiouridine(8) synthase ThiI [Thermoplasmata archaeon]
MKWRVDMRFISLMSGGIDSPVASHLVLDRGFEVALLNMDNRPFGGDDELRKVEMIAEHLAELHPGRVTLLRGKHGMSLQSFHMHSNPKYMCILCKRAMLKVADMLCTMNGYDGIIMGDSMGQVASQTLPNMAAVSAGVEHPILRPLIGFDKLDIEAVAKRIGTFELSIISTSGCTAAPKHPITHALPERVGVEASKADLDGVAKRVALSVTQVDIR